MKHEQIQYVPIDCIDANPQVRKTIEAEPLDGLAASIRTVGIQQPCRVQKVGDRFILIHGERRWRAAKMAGLTTVPVIIEGKDLSAGEILQRQLIENCQREDLQPLEKAQAFAALMNETGWKVGATASQLGMSSASATRLLALLTLPEPIRQQIADGKIAASAAYELSKVGNAEEQTKLAGDLASGRLTRDALTGSVRSRAKSADSNATVPTSRATAKLSSGRAVTVIGQSLNMEAFIEILEELLAKARKIRTQGVELPTFVKMLKDQAQQS